MIRKSGFLFILMMVVGLLTSCNGGPKEIGTETTEPEGSANNSTGIFSDNTTPTKPAQPNISGDVHTVTVLEVLPTQKYVYLRVKEGEEEFWVSTGKQDFKVGGTYFYRGGLLKTNFESKEHNRVFDKVYLVSSVVPANHGADGVVPGTVEKPPAADTEVQVDPGSYDREGSIKIAEIVANPSKYADKTVQLTGQCVKVNPNIMGRNWIHLKDGSKDDYDMVITSNSPVPEGGVLTISGIVRLNKDFGAGYKYELIIEDGTIMN
jgi:hypothetical protein